MSRKALHLVVDLEIQAVTCPGVWLCPNGNVQLLLSMLGQEVQTRKLPPVFPLLFHEKLTFQKTFSNAGCLAEVQDSLGREDVYAVLLQECEDSNGGSAVQLARFHSSALQILYPSPCSKGLLAGVDVDLLMEASADYPGILCPKIELSTKTIVKEVTSPVYEGYIINPKTLSSQRIPPPRHKDEKGVRTICSMDKHGNNLNCTEHGRRVKLNQMTAQSSGLRRSAPCTLNVQESHPNLKGRRNAHARCAEKCRFQEATPPDSQEICQCEIGHISSKCSLCTQYKAIFSSCPDSPDTSQVNRKHHSDICCKKPSLPDALERTRRLSKALHTHVDRILEPNMSGILHDRDLLNTFIPVTQSYHGAGCRTHLSDQKSDVTVVSKKASELDPCFQVSCGSGDEFNTHRQLFYANLEKFYRKLYDRAKNRAKEENC